MFRYRLIDFSRALAALAVAVVHWDVFMIAADWGDYARGELVPPLPNLLDVIYRDGNLAVQYFWMISGFIFAHVYSDGRVGFAEFAGRRAARLYPLHFATLLLVTLLQGGLVLLIGTTLFYAPNDLYHFFLNLTFTSAWGFEKDLSFNGPIWSVSVEIPIYILFWAIVRVLPLNVPRALIICVIFFFLQDFMPWTHIDYCGMLFFFGVATYHASLRFTPTVLALLSVLGWLIGYGMTQFVPQISASSTVLILIGFAPLLSLLAALDRMTEGHRGGFDHMASFGDLSYSIYLLHVPVIMLTTIGMIALGLDRTALSGALWPMLIYLGVVLMVSWMSLKWFEQPARYWLRQVFKPTHSAMVQSS